MCRPGLTFANCFANGRKCLTEQFLPSPLARVVGPGIIRPETNAPHWVQRAGFSQQFVASAQKVIFHGGILREFGVVARKHGVLLLFVSNIGVKVAHASTDAFVCAWVGRRHDELNCAMAFKKPGLFDHFILLR